MGFTSWTLFFFWVPYSSGLAAVHRGRRQTDRVCVWKPFVVYPKISHHITPYDILKAKIMINDQNPGKMFRSFLDHHPIEGRSFWANPEFRTPNTSHDPLIWSILNQRMQRVYKSNPDTIIGEYIIGDIYIMYVYIYIHMYLYIYTYTDHWSDYITLITLWQTAAWIMWIQLG